MRKNAQRRAMRFDERVHKFSSVMVEMIAVVVVLLYQAFRTKPSERVGEGVVVISEPVINPTNSVVKVLKAVTRLLFDDSPASDAG